MADQGIPSEERFANLGADSRIEEEEEFRSCCGDEEAWKETEDLSKIEEPKEDLDEFSVRLLFKGASIANRGDPGLGYSGIGVVMERSANFPVVRVQKKLDFYVDQPVADYLALVDGLVEATHHKIRRVYASTDSEMLCNQIMHAEACDSPLLMALKERVLEKTSDLESFTLSLVPRVSIEKPLRLAQVAVGIICPSSLGNDLSVNCSICCEDRPSPMMITMKCSHSFCSHCMRTYVDEKVRYAQVPIRCPQLGCKYYLSTAECKSFLLETSYKSFETALVEANIRQPDKFYCPYPNCSVLLDPLECLSTRASSSSQSENSCVECPVCQRFVCLECGVPWHSSMSCEEFQNLPLEERDVVDITLHRLAQNKRWRRCQQCRGMIELTHGCGHMTCRCGHEFCFSCGSEYRHGQQTCQCLIWDEDESSDASINHSVQESEQWAWETFNSLPMIMDAYSEQERSQLALIQRFLAGGFSLSDHQPYQSPPRCTDTYVDPMKDLHQLPWLERFVSVISDNFYEEYIQ